MSPEYLPPPNQHSSATGIPAAALAAAILWILFGAFMLFAGLMMFVEGQVGFLQLLFGGAYVTIAVRVLCAKPSGLLGGGITSIVLIALSAAGVAMVTSPPGDAPAMPPLAIAGAFSLTALLIIAGVLACVANRAYKAWRMARGGAVDVGAAAAQPVTHVEAVLAQPPACPSCRVAMRLDAETASWSCEGRVK